LSRETSQDGCLIFFNFYQAPLVLECSTILFFRVKMKGEMPQMSPRTVAENKSPVFSGRLHEAAFVLTACSAQFLSLAAMNQTVAPVLILADYFHIFDYGTLSWFSAAYSLTVGTFILPAG
jgi:hypothetical protein